MKFALFGMYKGPFQATFEGFVVLLNISISLSYVLFLNHAVVNHKQMLFFCKSWFQFSHRIKARAFSGGIWILWTKKIVVSIIENHSQFITLKVAYLYGAWFYVTAVYTSPSRSVPVVCRIYCIDKPVSWMVFGS